MVVFGNPCFSIIRINSSLRGGSGLYGRSCGIATVAEASKTSVNISKGSMMAHQKHTNERTEQEINNRKERGRKGQKV